MTVLRDYWNVLTDPGHTMAEITYDVLVYVLLTFVWNRGIKKMIKREHSLIDTEHKAGRHQIPYGAEALAEVHDLLQYKQHRSNDGPSAS